MRVASREGTTIKQVAALPYRAGPRGHAEILLITSRGTGRWVLPKGNRIRGLRPHQAAAREAFEEAGVTGVAAAAPIGSYRYAKERRDGSQRPALVAVYPLAVHNIAAAFPEQHERESRWFTLDAAARAVIEPELKMIIARFRNPGLPVPPVAGRTLRVVRWLRELRPRAAQLFGAT